MTCIIVGASAGLGRSLANRLAKDGNDLIIVSSDIRDLQVLASDLSLRYGIQVKTVACDVSRGDGYLTEIATAAKDMRELESFFFPIGIVSAHDGMDFDPERIERLTQVNYLSIVKTITYFCPRLLARPRAVIVGFGSIAATRGRKVNIAYSAAKRALESFFESLRHATAGTNVYVQFYVLGYLDTNLAFGVKTLLPRAKLEALSNRIVKNLNRDVGVVYYPIYWRFLCAVLRLIPWFIFKRLTF